MSERNALDSDGVARRAILEALDETLFVEAAAGTGKTTALVGRIVAVLRSGKTTLGRIAAVTFTEKAAGEMKLRLRAELERACAGADARADERRRLEAALEQLEVARIGTIHAFCADLLHERPIEAGVDPLFEVLSEDAADRALDAAFDAWFERTLADPPEGVRRVLRRTARNAYTGSPRAALRTAAASLVEHRDFPAAWQRVAFDRIAAIDALMAQLADLAALSPRADDPDDWLAKNLANLAHFANENALREGLRGRDHDALEAELRELARDRRIGWHWKGRSRRRFAEGIARDEVLTRRDALLQALHALLAAADADLAACLREELRPVVDAYQMAKRRSGGLDFVDLLLETRNLLVQDRDVRVEYQARFSHFFVDEFQDTDPLQAEILLLLAADTPEACDWRSAVPVPGKLFLVGDPKQAIYRFRRADIAIYEETKRRLAQHDARVLYLSKSFRAVPSLQAFVNSAFAPRMRGTDDASQAEYVALEPVRDEASGRPSLVALPAPRPYADYGRIVAWRAEQSLADAVGAFVHWLVSASGWTVCEKPGADPVPLSPRHVCLLFRRFKSFREDVTRPYVRALEARRVPHVLVGGRSFHEREEVLAIRNALHAIEWPDDALRVYATLRGPLFALGDDALLGYRQRQGNLHPLAPRDRDTLDADATPVAEALDVLAGLHRGRNRRPIADSVSELLEAVRAHAGIAIWPTGEQALANCLRTIDLARRFERRGAPSFRAFVEQLERSAERGGAEDAPVVEEGTEGVRIMTAHRAKGLEFPVVVLCEPACRATREQPTRHVDAAQGLWAEPLAGCAPQALLDHRGEEAHRDAAEAVRLAYVAATRARDLLVVPAIADAELAGGWLEVLTPALYPAANARGEALPVPGAPTFGDDAVLERPRGARRERVSVAPGWLMPRAGAQRVAWWDPHRLELDVPENVGLRQQRILEADAAGSAAAAGEQAHARWQAARAEALARGATPRWQMDTITSLAEVRAQAELHEDAAEIRVEEVSGRDPARPSGARFGTLVHAMLAQVDLAADAEALTVLAAFQGRVIGAPADEVAAAVRAVHAALQHPVLQRAAASAVRGGLRRETPVVLQLADGVLAEGIVDLAFWDAAVSGWTVVDFKTDRELEGRRAVYEAQVGLYIEAVSRATGEPAVGALLVV
jgi:ATP-dependent helicase/nuclease subunit A